MNSYDSFLEKARGLDLGDGPVLELVAEMLGRILEVEGPTPNPAHGDGHQAQIIMRHRGTAWFYAETWMRGPWRCLLLHVPSITMGRPITKAWVEGEGEGQRVHTRIFTDSQSLKAKGWIVAACRAFKIDAPIGPCVVHSTLNQTRNFIAWRPISGFEATWSEGLQGDVDNYLKIVLDGLQDAGVLRNDRTVVSAMPTKTDPWHGVPATAMPDRLAMALKEAIHQGDDPEKVRVSLGATKKLLAAVLDELGMAKPKRGRGRPKSDSNPNSPRLPRGRPSLAQSKAVRLYKDGEQDLLVVQEKANLSDKEMAAIFPSFHPRAGGYKPKRRSADRQKNAKKLAKKKPQPKKSASKNPKKSATTKK